MICKFCLWRPALTEGELDPWPPIEACQACCAYLGELIRTGFCALSRQLINLANVRRCRLAAG